MKAPIWQCGRYALELSRPYVMGVLNMTPDSFSDGGQYLDPQLAIDRAHQMIAEGADIIDIGGESTRPNAPKVCTCDELRRILPAIEALIDCGVPLSIDTQKPYVMREVLSLGVDIINDINGFNSPVAIDAVADSNAGLCIMHMQGTPQNMQADPHYADVVAEVAQFLGKQVQRLITAGVARERLCLDPGFGFGKTLAHNQTLMRHLPQLTGKHTLPLLVGVSRKRMIGTIPDVNQPPTACPAASPPRCGRYNTARTLCVCMMWRKRWMPFAHGSFSNPRDRQKSIQTPGARDRYPLLVK